MIFGNKITISSGNSKMGPIPSVSLPAGITCDKNAPCFNLCYANKIARFRKAVKNSYDKNYDVLKRSPEDYWTQVKYVMFTNTHFRFHVSGDIPDEEYLINMVSACRMNSHCDAMCFTKKYEIVNKYIEDGNQIPNNLHIIFSAWPGFEMKNPNKFPEAHVLFNDGSCGTDVKKSVMCSGNCTDCAITGAGCWTLKKGQNVVLKQH